MANLVLWKLLFRFYYFGLVFMLVNHSRLRIDRRSTLSSTSFDEQNVTVINYIIFAFRHHLALGLDF